MTGHGSCDLDVGDYSGYHTLSDELFINNSIKTL